RRRAPVITLRQVFGETQRELGSWGRLLTCAAVGYRRCPVQSRGVPSGSGRLTIGRSLASCPTSESRPHSPSSAKPPGPATDCNVIVDNDKVGSFKPDTFEAPSSSRKRKAMEPDLNQEHRPTDGPAAPIRESTRGHIAPVEASRKKASLPPWDALPNQSRAESPAVSAPWCAPRRPPVPRLRRPPPT